MLTSESIVDVCSGNYMPNLKQFLISGMTSLKNINCLKEKTNLENIYMSEVTIAI
jgi:hypothetical protein